MININNINPNNKPEVTQTLPAVIERISNTPVAQAAFAELKELFKGITNFENKNGFGKQIYAKDTDVELKPEQMIAASKASSSGTNLNLTA